MVCLKAKQVFKREDTKFGRQLYPTAHLRHVGDLRCGPVPGVDQDGVVGLLLPARVVLVHLLDPVGGGPGHLVPADDDASVAPPATEEGDHSRVFVFQSYLPQFCIIIPFFKFVYYS